MDLVTVRLLYGYDHWVNERLLATVDEVPANRLREKFGASFDSILGTLSHMLGSEINWLKRWKGESSFKFLTPGDFTSLEEIKVRWAQHQQEMDAFLVALTPEQLSTPLSYKNAAGASYHLPLWQLMLHAVNHETHHRSELADMLTRAGHPPKPTDLVRYCLELSGQS